MLRQSRSVNRASRSVNRYDHEDNRRLKPLIARKAASGPCKVIALELGVSPSLVRDAKEERRSLSWPAVAAFARNDPAIAREVLAIMSGCGEANDPANIDRMIRFFMQRSGGT